MPLQLLLKIPNFFLLKYNNPELSQYHIADILNVSQPVINKRFKRIKQKYLLESQISL